MYIYLLTYLLYTVRPVQRTSPKSRIKHVGLYDITGLSSMAYVLDPETGPKAPPTLFFLLMLVLRLFHFKTDRRQTSRSLHTGDNILHNHTVTDFKVKPQLLNNN